MKKNNLINLLNIIKSNQDIIEREKLNLNLNKLFELNDIEIKNIFNSKNNTIKFWKIILFIENNEIDKNKKDKVVKIFDNNKLSDDNYFCIYNSIKEISKSLKDEKDFNNYFIKLQKIINLSSEDFQIKYASSALSNIQFFWDGKCDLMLEYILFSKQEHQAMYGYLMTLCPNIMKNDQKIDVLRLITSTTTCQQADNTLKAANNTDTHKHKFYLDILEKISRSHGKYQSMYGYLVSTDLKLLNNKYFLYMLDLITSSKEDFQVETMYRLLKTDIVYRKDCLDILEIIKQSKSKYHASSLYKLIDDSFFMCRKNVLQTLNIINEEAENKNQILYSCKIIKALNELGINDSNLERIVLLFATEKDFDKLKYMYDLVEIFPRVPKPTFIRILKMIKKAASKEDAYNILKTATDDALLEEDEYYKKLKLNLKQGNDEYVDRNLEDIMNMEIDELIDAISDSKKSEMEPKTLIKVKKNKIENL